MLYPMSPKVFQEVSDKVAKRLAEHVTDVDKFYVEYMPGLTKKSGREKLAFYRTTDEAYWERLSSINMARAKANLAEWSTLVRRYSSIALPATNGAVA